MDEEKQKLLILIVLRLLVVTLLFAGALFLGPEQTFFQWPFVLAGYALSALYLWLWKYIKRSSLVYNIQFYCDLIFVSVLVHSSGGIDSPFVPFYVLNHCVCQSGSAWRRGDSGPGTEHHFL